MGWVGAAIKAKEAEVQAQFQSLRGFGVGWSGRVITLAGGASLVSIPERVWGGLERKFIETWYGASMVSIPERVWGGLEPGAHGIVTAGHRVSIPERVWGGLEP